MRTRRFLGVWTFILLAQFSSSSALGQEASFPFPLTQYQLRNGLNVILSEDYSLPLVSVVLAYHVGSIQDPPGKTGLAYFLENMMFMGSLNIGPMQHISYVNRTGGQPNASTTEDITYLYETVPSNQLALVLWLESDRMKTLEINAAKTERIKQALLDEIEQRKAGEPYFESSLAFDKLLYPDSAYSHPVLGSEEDIRSLTAVDVKNFYAAYYVPNNAVLSIVGDINLAKARELVEKYFETIPQGNDNPVFSPPEPPEKKQLAQVFQEPLAPRPAFHLGYRLAPPYSSDYYPLAILDYILLKGNSSRLYRRLVKKEALAFYLSGGIEKRGGAAAFKMFAMNNNDAMVGICQKAIFSEINKLRTNYVSSEELDKAKNMFKKDYVSRFSSSMEKAMFLAEIFFSPVGLEKGPGELGKYLQVTPFAIIGTVNRYFTPENSILLNVKIR
jgi:zinc protease